MVTKILWAVLAVAVAVWLFLQLGGGPEAAVNARLDELAEAIEKDDAGEGDLQAAARSRAFSEFFAEGFRVSAPQVGGELADRARLMQTYLGYRRRYGQIDASFRERKLEVDASGSVVDVECVATLSSGDGLAISRDRYRLAMRWRDSGGEWKLTDVEMIEVLEGGLL